MNVLLFVRRVLTWIALAGTYAVALPFFWAVERIGIVRIAIRSTWQIRPSPPVNSHERLF